MDNEEIMRQRKIGKQLMLIEIIHCEDKRVQETGFSLIKTDQMASWALMAKEEIDDIVDSCRSLDPISLAEGAAEKYGIGGEQELDRNSYIFVLTTYVKYGLLFCTDISEPISVLCEVIAPYIFSTYTKLYEEYPVDSSYGTGAVLEQIILDFLKHFVATVEVALSKGYDWEVIAKMIQEDVSKARFQEIKEYCFSGSKRNKDSI